MAWWDDVQYDSLADWVPTLGKPPGDTLHDLALIRGAVCKQIYDAHELGDMLAQGRAEKLLTFLDRLVLHSPRTTRRGKRKALSKTITARLRLAWAGDWTRSETKLIGRAGHSLKLINKGERTRS